jgi:HlyD family secretion protein
MKTKTRLAVALGGLALLALLAWAFAPRPLEVETAPVARREFVTFIEEDGKTRLRERYTVAAPLAGRLARIALREGDTVAAGAPLAWLSPSLPPLLDPRSERGLQAQLAAAQARQQAAQARAGAAAAAAQRSSEDLQRSEALARQGFVADSRLAKERLGASAARQELEAARQEAALAAHQVEQARAALLAVRAPQQLPAAGLALRAPVAGRVLRVLQPSETVVAQGTPLLELGDLAGLEVVAELLSNEALAVRPGSAVLIERWGGPQPLQGRVRLVEPGGFTKISALGVEEQRVRVLIELLSPPAEWAALGDGYQLGLRILTLAPAQRLSVPVGALFPRAAGGQAAFVLQGGRAQERALRIAARNQELAWIEDGLAEGEQVLLYPPASLRDGARVRVRR